MKIKRSKLVVLFSLVSIIFLLIIFKWFNSPKLDLNIDKHIEIEDWKGHNPFSETLILVACHAATVKESLDGASHDDNVWALMDYQLDREMPEAILKHIQTGVKIADSFPNSILLFSGGQTRIHAGPRSEAYSYYSIAEHYNFFNSPQVKERTFIEEFARDSFENLLFSLCRFNEIKGMYPEQVIVVSFSFKKYRFESLHRAAVRFPLNNFKFISSDPKNAYLRGSKFDLEKFIYFEKERSVKPFETDPYGCFSKVLLEKRQIRNPFKQTIPYSLSCPEMTELLAWCNIEIFPGLLPWSDNK